MSGGNHPDDRLAAALERQARALERQEEERSFDRMRTRMFGRLEKAPPAGREEARPAAPRWRPPAGLPLERVERLDALLAERKRAGRPPPPSLTLRAIAQRVGFNYDRVRQGEQLRDHGWDLRRSHPDFSVNDGFVRWPQPSQVPDLLG